MTDKELIEKIIKVGGTYISEGIDGCGYSSSYEWNRLSTKKAKEIISLCKSHFEQDWISVEDGLPLMYIQEDSRGGDHWYCSDQKIWITDGIKVTETSFFQVWPDKGKALSINLDNITHWKPYETPSPPENKDERD